MPTEIRTFNGKRYLVNSETDDVISEVKEKPAVNVAPSAKITPSGNTNIGDRLSMETKPNESGTAEEGAKNVANEPLRRIGRFGLELVPPLIGGAATVGGGLAGGVPGAIGGNLLGNQLGSRVGRGLRDVFGVEQPETSATQEGLANSAIDGLTFGTAKVLQAAPSLVRTLGKGAKASAKFRLAEEVFQNKPLATSLARKVLNNKTGLSPETGAFLQQNPDFPITLGQIRGQNSNINFFENLLAKEEKLAVEAVQQDMLQKRITEGVNARSPIRKKVGTNLPVNPPELNAGVAKEELAGGFEKLSGLEKKTWDQTRALAEGYKVKVQGKPKKVPMPAEPGTLGFSKKTVEVAGDEETIAGPIQMTKSRDVAKSILDKVKVNYNKSSTEELFSILEGEQKPLIAILDRIANTEGPVPMEVATDLIRITGAKGFKNDLAGNVNEALFRKLREDLKQDGINSIKGWEYGLRDETLRAWNRANAMTRQKNRVFKDIKEVSDLMFTPYTGKQELSAVLQDANSIKMAIRGAKDRVGMRKTLQAEKIADWQNRSSVDGQFKPLSETLLEVANRNDNAEFDALFTPAERKNLIQISKVIRDLPAGVGNQGQVNLTLRETSAGVEAGGSLGKMIGEGSFKAAGIKTIGVILGGKSFIRNVALNPEIARAALQLQKIPINAPKSKALTRIIFSGLRGTELLLKDQEGKEHPAIIGNDGVEMIAPE